MTPSQPNSADQNKDQLNGHNKDQNADLNDQKMPRSLEIPHELRSQDDEVAPYVAPDKEKARADRYRQAKAWSIALDPVYGLIGMGVVGFGIDNVAGTGKTWTLVLSLLGLVGGFYLFIKQAMILNKEQMSSSKRTDGNPDS
ncbi:MAG: AtpZ/AtpI family protein [Phycisphaerales bacterium]